MTEEDVDLDNIDMGEIENALEAADDKVIEQV